MKRARILLVSEVFPPENGGSGRWFWEVYRRLPRESVFVLADEYPGHAEFDRTHDIRIERARMGVPDWGILSPGSMRDYWKLFHQIRRIVRREGITHMHCARSVAEGSLGWMLNRYCGLSYLCYVHGEEMRAAASSRQLTWMTKRALRRASLFIANSQNTVRLLTDEWGVPEEMIRILNPGVDASKFVPVVRNMADRNRFGWGDRNVVLTVGRLTRRKGHDMMIRALPIILQHIPDLLYVIVGNGEDRGHLVQLVSDAGLENAVQFMGEIGDGDLVRCYQQCDLFALPNREYEGDFEGFGMVLLEAQACGKPVVAGDSGGTAETMRIPETGRVVCCDGPNALAGVIVELLRDRELISRMGLAGREWVMNRFDWPVLTRQAEEIFAEQSSGIDWSSQQSPAGSRQRASPRTGP